MKNRLQQHQPTHFLEITRQQRNLYLEIPLHHNSYLEQQIKLSLQIHYLGLRQKLQHNQQEVCLVVQLWHQLVEFLDLRCLVLVSLLVMYLLKNL